MPKSIAITMAVLITPPALCMTWIYVIIRERTSSGRIAGLPLKFCYHLMIFSGCDNDHFLSLTYSYILEVWKFAFNMAQHSTYSMHDCIVTDYSLVIWDVFLRSFSSFHTILTSNIFHTFVLSLFALLTVIAGTSLDSGPLGEDNGELPKPGLK